MFYNFINDTELCIPSAVYVSTNNHIATFICCLNDLDTFKEYWPLFCRISFSLSFSDAFL